MGKVVTTEEAMDLRRRAAREGQKVVFTNGCFDILHRGHVKYLSSAKALGDLLLVGVNSDSSVGRIKGKTRPITKLEDRMAVLAALQSVDAVISFEEDTPQRLIEALLPDVLVKGGDWRPDEVVGREAVVGNGGKVVIVGFLEGYSTRGIIDRILEAYTAPDTQ